MKKIALAALATLALGGPVWCQQVSPPPNAQVSDTAQPLIKVIFASPMRSAKVLVDGQDFTSLARVEGASLILTPPYPLDPGVHQVVADGVNFFGQAQHASWSFSIAGMSPSLPVINNGGPNTPNAVFPIPGATVSKSRPELAADFPEAIRSARITLDGLDVGAGTQIYNARVKATPSLDVPAGHHSAHVQALGVSGQSYEGAWDFDLVSAGGGGLQPYNLNPPPGSVVRDTHPLVSADFPLAAGNLHLYLDQADYTGEMPAATQHLSWTPPYSLTPGPHALRLEASSPTGQPMLATWNFVVDASSNPRYADPQEPYQAQPPPTQPYQPQPTQPYQPQPTQPYQPQPTQPYQPQPTQPYQPQPTQPYQPQPTQPYQPQPTQPYQPQPNFPADGSGELSLNNPLAGDLVDSAFEVQGTSRPGAVVRVSVRVADGGRQSYYFKGQADPSGHFSVPIDSNWALQGTRLQIEVVAVDGSTGQRVAETFAFEVTRR